jgi:hypothetical protein
MSGLAAAGWISLFLLKRSKRRRAYYTSDCIHLMECRIQRDEGDRGIEPLVEFGDLEAAARDLLQANTVRRDVLFSCLCRYLSCGGTMHTLMYIR